MRRAKDWEWNNNLGLSSLWNPWIHTKEEVKVIASTLDKEVKKHWLNKLDFIKIDVEGFEFEVLEGGKESIKKYNPIIQYEFSPILDNLLKKRKLFKLFQFYGINKLYSISYC